VPSRSKKMAWGVKRGSIFEGCWPIAVMECAQNAIE
jgi:hypothetical protein